MKKKKTEAIELKAYTMTELALPQKKKPEKDNTGKRTIRRITLNTGIDGKHYETIRGRVKAGKYVAIKINRVIRNKVKEKVYYLTYEDSKKIKTAFDLMEENTTNQ